MGLMDQLGNLLGKYGAAQERPSDDEVHGDFDQIAPQASPASLSGGSSDGAAAFSACRTRMTVVTAPPSRVAATAKTASNVHTQTDMLRT